MLSKKAIRIIAIVLAALMALSVFAVIFQIVGLDETALAAAIPATGESNLPYLIPAIVIVAAVVAILCALLIPKLLKKKKSPESTAEAEMQTAPETVPETEAQPEEKTAAESGEAAQS